MNMLLTIKLLVSFTVLCSYRAQGANIFESLFFRLDCYKYEEPGCNKDFIDAHPEYAWSYLNVTKAETFFYMATNKRKDNPELMHKCGGALPPNTTFNPTCKTIIIIPGYASGICTYAIFREIKNQYLKAGCFNVLMVEWTWGNIFDLNDAKNNFAIVAGQIAIVINYLKNKYNLTPCDFEIIGHSYGAHIAGMVGDRTHVCKIIGADPSGAVQTENTPLSERLDAGDATCVQVIHTNGGQCLLNYFGVNFTSGTVDFWVNGGLENPSCYPNILESIIKGDFYYAFLSLVLPAACSHFQSLQFFKASINPSDCQFAGVKCDSLEDAKNGKCPTSCGPNGENCEEMGAYGCGKCDCSNPDAPKPEPKGNYYVKTQFNCPYCDKSWLDLGGFHFNKSS